MVGPEAAISEDTLIDCVKSIDERSMQAGPTSSGVLYLTPQSDADLPFASMFESVQKRAAIIARDGLKVRRLVVSCKKLLSERGEAAGVSLARITLDLYRELDDKERARFFAALLAEFSPDPTRVLAAANAYAAEPSASNLSQLSVAAEPPRQELLRRLNRAPGGTATILRMRELLLELKRDQTELDAVDWDMRHLLSSWFNPGFLQIVRVDWHTPAYLLEQIIVHEAVHEIRGWSDLRRRLAADGRCFAFFHPALPDEPLIFLEVALDGPDGRLGAALARCPIHVQRSQQGHHCRLLFDQQLPARLARHIRSATS